MVDHSIRKVISRELKVEKITPEVVRKIARLARIEIAREEEEMFARQLDKILTYARKLGELDTSRVEPTSHVVPMRNVLRKDEVKESLPPKDVLAGAPDEAQGCFRVPKIIE